MNCKYTLINWKEIQLDYNNGLSKQALLKKYNISRTVLDNAIRHELFVDDPTRKYKHTPETKNILSKRQKEYLQLNKDKHPWKCNSKFISKPCEKLKQILHEKRIKFVEEFSDFKDYNYSIDIAFPNNKIGIEINGNQHYNADGTLKKYYLEREINLQQLGWTIYQIHYSLIYNKILINTIINNILSNVNIAEYNSYVYIHPKQYCNICKKPMKKSNNTICNRCSNVEKYNAKINMQIQQILTANINFSKYGWVTSVSKILKMCPQNVSRWMKKHMTDFYFNNCKVRNI